MTPTDLTQLTKRVGVLEGGTDGIFADESRNLYAGVLETGTIWRWNTTLGLGKLVKPNLQELVKGNEGLGDWISDLFIEGGHLWIVVNR